MSQKLTLKALLYEARLFAERESTHSEPTLFGVTDGKAVGTYVEHKFRGRLSEDYDFVFGSSAKGIDFPKLEVDMKVTSIKQPQSSCPYQSARQKIFGLGYALLVFVYEKTDDDQSRTARLNILHTILVRKERTADYQTTTGILRILENQGNADDLVAFLEERRLPIDDVEARKIVREIMQSPPAVGYLTISNALQWRLQYSRVIENAGSVRGIDRIR